MVGHYRVIGHIPYAGLYIHVTTLELLICTSQSFHLFHQVLGGWRASARNRGGWQSWKGLPVRAEWVAGEGAGEVSRGGGGGGVGGGGGCVLRDRSGVLLVHKKFKQCRRWYFNQNLRVLLYTLYYNCQPLTGKENI